MLIGIEFLGEVKMLETRTKIAYQRSLLLSCDVIVSLAGILICWSL